MKCEICGNNAHVKCAVCNKSICTKDSKLVISCAEHIQTPRKVDFIIRPANAKDEDVIEAIEDSTIAEHEPEINEDAWEGKWKGVEMKQLVAESSKKVIGFVEYCKSVSMYEELVFMITDFAVLPQFQNTGIGSMLLKEIMKIARTDGLSKIYASTNLNNIPTIIFHLKNGAEIAGIEKIKEEGERWGIKGSNSIAFVYRL